MVTVNTSIYGEIVPRVTSCISVIASTLIIQIMLLSPTKLKPPAYRIMFCLSVSDIIGSTAMALSHAAMPKPGLNYKIDSYDFEGLRLGNFQTCSAQGFLVNFGILATCGYNAMLCIYYAFSIAFNVRRETMTKIVEPILYIFPIFFGIAGSITPLLFDTYNPSPWESWCTVDPVPYSCHAGCQRGTLSFKEMSKILPVVFILFDFVLITIFLGIVCVKVLMIHRQLSNIQRIRARRTFRNEDGGTVRVVAVPGAGSDPRRSRMGTRASSPEEQHQQQLHTSEQNAPQHQQQNIFSGIDSIQDRHSLMAMVLIQSLSYIFVQFITLIFPLLSSIGYKYERLRLIFQPLQGFFNFLIFIGFKVYHMRRSIRQVGGDISILGALGHILQWTRPRCSCRNEVAVRDLSTSPRSPVRSPISEPAVNVILSGYQVGSLDSMTMSNLSIELNDLGRIEMSNMSENEVLDNDLLVD